MYVIKRDGTKVPFNKDKIIQAVNKAFIEVDGELYEDETAEDIAEALYWHADALKRINKNMTVEEV